MDRQEILTLLYEKNDYYGAEVLCKEKNSYEYFEYLAISLYLQNKFSEAAEIYHKLEKYAEEGYCFFYSGNKSAADKIWFSHQDLSPLLVWAKAFSGYVERKRKRLPTFFQIRNFYENDLDMLLTFGFDEYAENLIDSIQFFGDVNLEIYKFTARVLYNHKYYNFADKFLYAAKECCNEDSELYVLDAKNNIAQKRYYSAVKSLEKALDVSKNYFPAKMLLEKIKKSC